MYPKRPPAYSPVDVILKLMPLIFSGMSFTIVIILIFLPTGGQQSSLARDFVYVSLGAASGSLIPEGKDKKDKDN